MYEELLPLVWDLKNQFSLEDVLMILVSANSMGVKKNQVKKMLFELTINKLEMALLEKEEMKSLEFQRSFHSCVVSLKNVIYKNDQRVFVKK